MQATGAGLSTFHQALRPRAHIRLERLWTLRHMGASPLNFCPGEDLYGFKRGQLLEFFQNFWIPVSEKFFDPGVFQ